MRTGSEAPLLAVSPSLFAKGQQLEARGLTWNIFPAIVVPSAREANHVLQRLR
jgi:hypothetical protein